MSVLIKGMKMPEKCGSCDLFHAESPMHCTVVKGHKTVGAPYGMPRPEWCPLVEIHAHGRLIDADALAQDLEEDVERDQRALDDMDIVGDERTKLQFDKDCKQNCMWYLTESFTVIEAEGGED